MTSEQLDQRLGLGLFLGRIDVGEIQHLLHKLGVDVTTEQASRILQRCAVCVCLGVSVAVVSSVTVFINNKCNNKCNTYMYCTGILDLQETHHMIDSDLSEI